ncbi:uncharacterized protein LOC134208379 [Armigeres subalbatus]|uniref:uncharacterized protein LOC134208379 n=1 Tax=Armigeres subalbatus TaxID=124917 RepID=UPI002ED60F6F
MNIFKCLLVISCLATVSLAHSASAAQSINSNTIDDSHDPQQQTPRSGSYLGEIKYLYKTYQDCANSDVPTCLKLKLFTILDRVARSLKDFKISEGVKFVRDQDVPIDSTPVKSEAQIEMELPRSMDEKERSLNSMLFDKVLAFFQTHTLQVKFPSSEEIKRSMEEVRAGGGGFGGGGGLGGGFGNKDKDKKNGHWIMIPLLLGSTLVPLAFGALALLAGKALIVSKLALALASIIGIKKLISSGGGHHESAHEVVVSGGHGGGWGRIGAAQGLPYNGYGHYAQ